MDEIIKKTVKEYIVAEFLPWDDSEALTISTPLITGGILDSMAVAKLITFLEETYQIVIEAHEIDFERLNNISTIAAFVQAKLESEGTG